MTTMFIKPSLANPPERRSLAGRILRIVTGGLSLGVVFQLCIGPGPAAAQTPAAPRVLLPAVAMTSGDLGIVINDADRASVETGLYYARARKIPPDRVVRVSFPVTGTSLGRAEFERVKAEVDARMPAAVQALALAWTRPYRVECMSITAAFAFGFDVRHCAEGCATTRASPYYDSDSTAPFRELGVRPAMLLAGRSVAAVKRLIDRGVRSDDAWPGGRAYLLSTGDGLRNVRAVTYARTQGLVGAAYPVERLSADALRGRTDVMFYFTGAGTVADLGTNRFVDGAIGDHLTSSGGMLTDSPQMSSLEWIEAGATGSYGTALEPCNFRQKFPSIPVVLGRYLSGETLIEAYWKSVEMPGQGVFIGEPLARPFAGIRGHMSRTSFDLRTRALRRGRYLIQAANSGIGPFRTVGEFAVGSVGVHRLQFKGRQAQVYRLVRETP